MGTILDVIQKIRKRPVTMLGRPSASHLYAFLSGYAAARQGEDPSDYEFLSGFNQWVHERYEVTSTQDWGKIIEFQSGAQADELPLFWKLFDQYLATLSAS